MGDCQIWSKPAPIFRDLFGDDTLVGSEGISAADVSTGDSSPNFDLLNAAEKPFCVTFSIKDFRNLKNVGELLDLITRKAA